MTTKIAVIGLGFVGGAIYQSLRDNFIGEQSELVAVDPAKGHNTTYEEIADFDAVFVCVPSPQNDDGTEHHEHTLLIGCHFTGGW